MKKSQIQKIIREEFVNILREQTLIKEAFQDPIARMLAKTSGTNNRYLKFFNQVAKSYDIAFDKLPKGSFQKVMPGSPLTKKGMAFWYIKGNKDNPYAGSNWFSQTLEGPAVLAVTIDNKIAYISSQGVGPGKTRQSIPAGKATKGTMQVKKLKELADAVYVLDLETYRGGTTGLKSARATLKLGKDKFTDDKAWKRANLERYDDILKSRIGGRDQVDRYVAEIVKMANQAVSDAVSGVLKQDKYGDIVTTINGNEVEVRSVTDSMTRALDTYKRYIQYENQEDEESQNPGAPGYRNYYDKQKKEYALELKQYYIGFKKGKLKRY